ncbi:MAG: hypothetical protein F4138_06170 [Acidimicrobiia bacterium]|nr:hypothetical protein [Acidimicrobiia bacterium]MYC57359.1 hypothetical protein [Acidimicrobiia bacterium]MYG94562.1 hypothetical protein [Acidimicrobiia bacterium]MYI31155.1 hypothetical protein [Acidimicrobiia bacterium]
MGADQPQRRSSFRIGALNHLHVRVLTDVTGIHKEFVYSVPSGWESHPCFGVGAMVRVVLHGRRVRAWITEVGVEPLEGLASAPLAKLSSRGPTLELLELSEWAAWRWAGHRAHFLRTASPPRMVNALPRFQRSRLVFSGDFADLFAHQVCTFCSAPAQDLFPIAVAAAHRGQALILVPDRLRADQLAKGLSRVGVWAQRYPQGWAAAAAGATVVGTLAAAWAPAPELAAVLVIDEHDEAFRSESAPTWSGREVARERARRAGVPCVLVSPAPSLEALRSGSVIRLKRDAELKAWPDVSVVDRRVEDPSTAGLYSPTLVKVLRSNQRVACVLNRLGRSLLLACQLCGELAVCEECGASMRQGDRARLDCRTGNHSRPLVCAECGSTAMKNLRVGVKRAREELEALIKEPVAEITAKACEGQSTARVVVGTEAVLHLGRPFDVVAFLEFDQELLMPRYRAREQAMALLVRGARVAGPHDQGGRLLIQTRMPDDPVVRASASKDPWLLARSERDRRQELGFPPYGALAVVSGVAADEYMEGFGSPSEVRIAHDPSGSYYLRAVNHEILCDALASVQRPAGRLRIDVDPVRAL